MGPMAVAYKRVEMGDGEMAYEGGCVLSMSVLSASERWSEEKWTMDDEG